MSFNCEFFKAVSDPNRVKMMMLLCGKERTVTDICGHFKMKQPSISHHLGILKNAGIVEPRKDGKEVFYRLKLSCVSSHCGDLIKMFAGKEEK